VPSTISPLCTPYRLPLRQHCSYAPAKGYSWF
jgi:hypothetical protein